LEVTGVLASGLLIGCVYAIMTIGLNIIFGVLRIVNVGHGAFMMIGAYTVYWLYTLLDVPPVAGLLASAAVGLLLGLGFYYLVIRWLVGAPELATLLATFAIGILLQEVAKTLWEPDPRGFTWYVGSVEVGGLTIYVSKILAAVIALTLVALVYLLLYRTRFGLAIRAVVQDREGAMVVGVNVDRVYALSFAVGIAITAAAGGLVAIYHQSGIHPYMGEPYTLKAFVIAVMGGLGSVTGALIGGLLFGLFETASYPVLSWATAALGLAEAQPLVLTRFIAFSLLLLILLVRPQGLMGGRW
jgi:branched-chain amino acid transport system permease protein